MLVTFLCSIKWIKLKKAKQRKKLNLMEKALFHSPRDWHDAKRSLYKIVTYQFLLPKITKDCCKKRTDLINNPLVSCRQLLCILTGRDANCTLEMAAPRVSDQNPSSPIVHSYWIWHKYSDWSVQKAFMVTTPAIKYV